MSEHEEPSQASDAGFLARELVWQGAQLPYVVHRQPDYRARESWPAIVFLHGIEQSGTDGMEHVTLGLPPLLQERPEDWPFVSILPQKPQREQEWSPWIDAVLAMIDRAVAMDRVDPKRVHLTGLSQGGYGALRLAAAHPHRFRTVSAVCPYIAPPRDAWQAEAPDWPESGLEEIAQELAIPLTGLPTWLLHGTADDVVPHEHSLILHQALSPHNEQARLTLYPGAGHRIWQAAYALEGLWRWMQAQQL